MEPWVILGGSCVTEKPTPIWAVTLGSYVSRVSSVTWRQLHQRRFFSCLLLLWPQGRSLWVLCQECCEFCKLEALMSLIISFSPSRKKRREYFSLGKQTLYYWLFKAWQAQEYTENSFKRLMCLCVYVWTHMCMLCGYMGTCVPWHIYGARRQFSGVYSTLSSQGISCFYSTAHTRLWSSISSPVAVLGLQMCHSTPDCLHGFWALDLDCQTCMASFFTRQATSPPSIWNILISLLLSSTTKIRILWL